MYIVMNRFVYLRSPGTAHLLRILTDSYTHLYTLSITVCTSVTKNFKFSTEVGTLAMPICLYSNLYCDN